MATTATGGSALPERPARPGWRRVRHLREHGYEVVATDAAVSGDDVAAGVLRADLTDYGQATEALRGTDAVVHLANIPAPGMSTPAVTFNANVTMNFNVFHAAAALGLPRWCGRRARRRSACRSATAPSSSLARRAIPRYAPVDEDHFPFPTTTYALSKVASETIAEQISRWSGIPFVGLRISNIMEARRLPAFPVLLAGPAAAQVERCGATSTSATSPPPAASAWKRTSPAARTSSSRPPTRS